MTILPAILVAASGVAVALLGRRLLARTRDAGRRRSRLASLRDERDAHLVHLDRLLAEDAAAFAPPEVVRELHDALREARLLPANDADDAIDDALLDLRVTWERAGGTGRSEPLQAWDRTMSELQNAISFLRGLLAGSG